MRGLIKINVTVQGAQYVFRSDPRALASALPFPVPPTLATISAP